MGEKTPKTKKRKKPRKKIFLVWLSTKNGGRLFSGVRKHRKQAGPTLGGTGVLVLWAKKYRVGRGMGQ